MQDSEMGECSKNLEYTRQPLKRARPVSQDDYYKSVKGRRREYSPSATRSRAGAALMASLESMLERAEPLISAAYEDEDFFESAERLMEEAPVPPEVPETYDECMLKWQRTQHAISHIDNCINSVFDNYLVNSNIRSEMFLREQGISMAIESHGLYSCNVEFVEAKQTEPSAQLHTPVNYNSPKEENTDFYEAAVLAAIDKKGLHM